MPKTYLKLAATGLALSLVTLSQVSPSLAAQEPADKPAAEATGSTLDDPTIVAIFDAANTGDIETGKLGAERGNSNEVRQFGAMLARDHQMVRQQGRDLAKKLGVTPTPPADKSSARDHAAAMHQLRELRGGAFDRAFLQHEVEFHRAVIAAMKSTLLPAITNQELRALVVKVAPAFEAHMVMAENLGKQLATR